MWGLDLVGKLKVAGGKEFYLKDHLGSIRVILNENNSIISAQDYDAWGYLMENRTYSSNLASYKFTGKQRDNESSYDYFGARYYDSRIGRWGGVEPLLNKYISFTPYGYSLQSPILLFDDDGFDVKITGEQVEETFSAFKGTMTRLDLNIDNDGKLSYNNMPPDPTKEEVMLMNAIDNPNIVVNLITTDKNYIKDEKGEKYYFAVGLYGGSIEDNKKVEATQYFNIVHADVWQDAGGSTPGKSVLHEVLEAYIGSFFYPGTTYDESYLKSHEKTISMEDPKQVYPTTVYDKSTGTYYLKNEKEEYFKLYEK